MDYLFKTNEGYLTEEDFLKAMIEVDASKAKILFIHFAMTFGVPNPNLSRNEILSAIYSAIQKLEVKTIILPTFTFSFPNGRDYDVKKSKSKMGALNEYIRKQPEAIRSIDPLMSIALVGEKKYLATQIGHESCGKDCIFDLLHNEDDVKFMFLGTRPKECFTYTHWIEWSVKVPYRYDREFSGKIINGDKVYNDTYKLFVRYKDVIAGANDFEDLLLDKKFARMTKLGDSAVYCVDEKSAYDLLCEKISGDINYMLAKPFPHTLIDEFILNEEMVAL